MKPWQTSAYVFARSGIVGLVLWLNRRRMVQLAMRYLSGPVVAVSVVALLMTTNTFSRLQTAHRREIVAERRYSPTRTADYSWRHSDLRVTGNQMASRRQRLRARAYVSFADWAVHNGLMAARYGSILLTLLVPGLWLAAWVQRTKEDAWAAEFGNDSDRHREARRRDEQAAGEKIAADDWLLNPPGRAPRRRPRFGAPT